MFDGKAFGEDMTVIVRGYVDRAVAPLIAENKALTDRIAKLEAREPLKGDPGKDGKDGTSVDAAVVDQMVAAIAKAVAEIPAPQDGKSVDLGEVRELVAAAVAELPAPRDGHDADPAAIETAVARAVAALPAPRDGTSITTDDVAPMIAAAVERAVGALPAAKDGVGLAGALIDRHGALIVTLTDGTTRDLGGVVGKDADMPALLHAIDDKVAALPAPVNGIDGFGFDDLSVEQSGERSFVLRFTKGERTKEFAFDLPVVIDRGVYKDGATYAAGDGVTWAGSYWIAQKETASKPDSGEGFRLAVKRGRDGRDKL